VCWAECEPSLRLSGGGGAWRAPGQATGWPGTVINGMHTIATQSVADWPCL